MNPGDFRLTCRHCGVVLLAIGPRLTDEALRMFRDHIRQDHPHLALPSDADAGAILAPFDVERMP